jgi:hypothetical protein
MPTMILADYRTEDELAAALKERIGFGSLRMLRDWRRRRIGPPWAVLGARSGIIYPNAQFDEWVSSRLQEPVRSRSSRRVA